jgi:DNA-binding NtrC family response regulator
MKTSTDPPKRILVMVHDEPIAEIVPFLLQRAGYECETAWGHEAILDALERGFEYDLVFCQVVALEREEEFFTWTQGAGRGIPIVACAARSPEYVPKAIQERCSLLQVPFERKELLAVVRETLTKQIQPVV